MPEALLVNLKPKSEFNIEIYGVVSLFKGCCFVPDILYEMAI
jgi:hypothetical protein